MVLHVGGKVHMPPLLCAVRQDAWMTPSAACPLSLPCAVLRCPAGLPAKRWQRHLSCRRQQQISPNPRCWLPVSHVWQIRLDSSLTVADRLRHVLKETLHPAKHSQVSRP